MSIVYLGYDDDDDDGEGEGEGEGGEEKEYTAFRCAIHQNTMALTMTVDYFLK